MSLYVDEEEFNDATQSLDAACHLAEVLGPVLEPQP